MICKLCLVDRKLLRSHIIPEFLYKSAYDEIHRAQEINLKPPNDIRYLQKGYREELFCADCEQFLNSNYEVYFNNIWYEKGFIPRKITKKKIILKGIDYSKFKLFLLSILWRASISSLDVFNQVNIGAHEEVIRIKLLNTDAGDEREYPIYPQFILFPGSNLVFDDLIVSPVNQVINGNNVVLFVFGGCSWFFFYDSLLVDRFNPILKKGTVILGVKPFEDMKIIAEPLYEMKKNGLI